MYLFYLWQSFNSDHTQDPVHHFLRILYHLEIIFYCILEADNKHYLSNKQMDIYGVFFNHLWFHFTSFYYLFEHQKHRVCSYKSCILFFNKLKT